MGTEMYDASPDRSGPENRPLGPSLHLIAHWAFAVAQPLFDVVGRNAVLLPAHRASRLEVLFVVLLLALGGPAILLVVEVLVRWMSIRTRHALQLLFVDIRCWNQNLCGVTASR